eukprot:5493860-Alexandrium_andersonii.AAC.1
MSVPARARTHTEGAPCTRCPHTTRTSKRNPPPSHPIFQTGPTATGATGLGVHPGRSPPEAPCPTQALGGPNHRPPGRVRRTMPQGRPGPRT